MKSASEKINVPVSEQSPESDDRRLVGSGAFVFALVSVFSGFFHASQSPSFIADYISQTITNTAGATQGDMIYPVLVEQKSPVPVQTSQIRALSDVNSQGTGGITERKGFHTLSGDDTMLVSYGNQVGAPAGTPTGTAGLGAMVHNNTAAGSESTTGRTFEHGETPAESSGASSQGEGSGQKKQLTVADIRAGKGLKASPMRIPSNYRFQADFAMRYDQSPTLSIATRELAGFQYFRDMLRQIRENFAPPGLNTAYRDNMGRYISQPIKPQVVKVLFLLDETGKVQDVRVVSSMGQTAVDSACVRSLLNQNFGPPPPEVLRNGNIFGINFVFPAVMNR